MWRSFNHGYKGLEIDVKTTSDGEYVCWHDDDLSRVGHDVSIPNSQWADIKDLTLTQTRSGNTYTGKLCSVDRYLEICKENNVFPIIELKWAVGINVFRKTVSRIITVPWREVKPFPWSLQTHRETRTCRRSTNPYIHATFIGVCAY